MDRVASIFTDKFFLIGAGFIVLSLGSVCFGVCPGRGGRAYRSKEPGTFWFGVIIYFLAGVLFWVRFLYQSN